MDEKILLYFLKQYYQKFLATPIDKFNQINDKDNIWISILQKKPNCDTLPLDLYPELELAFGGYLGGRELGEKYGLLSLFPNASIFGEETGFLGLEKTIMDWPSHSDTHIWIDAVDGSSRMCEALKGNGSVEKAIRGYIKEKLWNLATESPSTGIVIVKNEEILFSAGLNLFTGEVVGAEREIFYIPQILDFNGNYESLQIGDGEIIQVVCYCGGKGHNNPEYQENFSMAFPKLEIVAKYPTGPLRILYLKQGYLVASNREKPHDMWNTLNIGLRHPELKVIFPKNTIDKTAEIIQYQEEGYKINMPFIESLPDPRHTRTTFLVVPNSHYSSLHEFH